MPDDISEVEENIRILVEAALEVQHRLDGHDQAVEDCPTAGRSGETPWAEPRRRPPGRGGRTALRDDGTPLDPATLDDNGLPGETTVSLRPAFPTERTARSSRRHELSAARAAIGGAGSGALLRLGHTHDPRTRGPT